MSGFWFITLKDNERGEFISRMVVWHHYNAFCAFVGKTLVSATNDVLSGFGNQCFAQFRDLRLLGRNNLINTKDMIEKGFGKGLELWCARCKIRNAIHLDHSSNIVILGTSENHSLRSNSGSLLF